MKAGIRSAITLGAALVLVSASCHAPIGPTPAEDCVYKLTPAAVTPCMATTQVAVTVMTTLGCSWHATTTAPWLTIATGASANGPGSFTFAVADNWEAPRTGVVSVATATPGTNLDVRVSQAGCSYAVTTSAFTFPAFGGTDSFTVMQMSDPNTCGGPLQNACVWSAVSDSPAWLTVSGNMPQSGDQLVRFTVAPNATGASRVGTISVRDKSVRITQAG